MQQNNTYQPQLQMFHPPLPYSFPVQVFWKKYFFNILKKTDITEIPNSIFFTLIKYMYTKRFISSHARPCVGHSRSIPDSVSHLWPSNQSLGVRKKWKRELYVARCHNQWIWKGRINHWNQSGLKKNFNFLHTNIYLKLWQSSLPLNISFD